MAESERRPVIQLMTKWKRILQNVDPTCYCNNKFPQDTRLADVIVTEHRRIGPIEHNDIVLIGFPEDEGVQQNHGRPGASQAPDRIRAHLSTLVAFPALFGETSEEGRIKDLGNIRCDGGLEKNQDRLSEIVALVLSAGGFPMVIGGGHETAFGHFLGYVRANRKVGIISVDAHLDVRPLKDAAGHSGSPFRQVIEHPGHIWVPGAYLCVGVQGELNTAAAFKFMRAHQAKWIPLESVTQGKSKVLLENFVLETHKAGGDVMLTLDLDSVRQSDAPGVSAPSPIGLTAEQARFLVTRFVSQGVTSFDISECNPVYDRDDQTARLAALIIHEIARTVLGCPSSSD